MTLASGTNFFNSFTTNAGSGPVTLGMNGSTTTIATVTDNRRGRLTLGITSGRHYANLTDNTTVAALTVSASSGAVITINAIGGASGSTIAFGGDGTGNTTITATPGTAGQLLKVTAGTVTLTNARNSSENYEVDGGSLIFNNTRLSTNAQQSDLQAKRRLGAV